MQPNDDKAHLIDILGAAKLALSYIAKKTSDIFTDDLQCQDAVIRRLEIIGEAARRVSQTTRDRYPDLPWDSMTGMRNVLIHEYDEVDTGVVWETVQRDLPSLVHQLEKILSKK